MKTSWRVWEIQKMKICISLARIFCSRKIFLCLDRRMTLTSIAFQKRSSIFYGTGRIISSNNLNSMQAQTFTHMIVIMEKQSKGRFSFNFGTEWSKNTYESFSIPLKWHLWTLISRLMTITSRWFLKGIHQVLNLSSWKQLLE